MPKCERIFSTENDLPIKYTAIYEDQISTQPGIKYVGEVILSTKVKRGSIPVPSKGKPDAIYYYFKVRKWVELPEMIAIKDTNRTPRLTNKFLLDNCSESYQLFNISSEAEYRLVMELNTAFDNGSLNKSDKIFITSNANGKSMNEILNLLYNSEEYFFYQLKED